MLIDSEGADSTTPLRSGLVPLAPVGPHELSSFISGLSWAHETNAEVYAMEEKSHACETLEQRGFWLCRQRSAVKVFTPCAFLGKNRDPLFL